MELKNEHFGKWITSTLKILKCGSAERWKSLVSKHDKKRKRVTYIQGGNEHPTYNTTKEPQLE